MSTTPDLDNVLKQARHSFRKKQYPQAQDLFEQALQIDDANVDAHDGLAMACLLAGDNDRAIKHFTRITELAPTRAAPYVNLGAVYNRKKEYEKAVAALRKAVSRDKKSADGYYNLAIAQRGLNQRAMAMSAYRECIRIKPDMAEAHQNLANLFLEMENFQQAKLHYQKALEYRPDFERAERGLQRTQRKMVKQREEANPFGRLVDQHSHRARATIKFERVLTDQERVDDRASLHTFATEIDTFGRSFLTALKNDLDGNLTNLHKAIADGSTGKAALPQAHDQFLQAIEMFETARLRLKHKLMELRAYEELMNTPPLDA